MGTFENIRKISPYFFAAFAVMLVAFFTIGDQTVVDGIMSRDMNPQTRALGTVNGTPIYLTKFDELVQQQIQQQRSQQQDPTQPIDEARIRTQVWNDYVDKLILEQEAAKAGIKVTNEEIIDALLVNPPEYLQAGFKDSAGVFQQDVYTRLLTDPENFFREMMPEQTPEERMEQVQKFRQEIIDIQEYIMNDKLRSHLNNVVGLAGSVVSNNYAIQKYTMENSTADVDVVKISISDLEPEAMQFKDEDIKKYYEENKKYFRQKEQRQAKYIALPITPSADDSLRAQRRVQSVMDALAGLTTPAERDSVFEIKMSELGGESVDYQLLQDIDQQIYSYLIFLEPGSVAGPALRPDGTYFFRLDGKRQGENEVVKASHILISFDNNKDSALTVARSIARRAKGGEDFAQLAREYSKDPGSGAQGGDLGFFGRGMMVPEFEQAAFASEINQITDPVESQFGYHIIKVTDKQSEELAYSVLRITPSISGPTRSNLFVTANDIADEIRNGQNIDSVAARYELTSGETPFFERSQPVLNSNYLTSLAYKAELGDVLPTEEFEPYGIVIMQVTEERLAGVPTLEAVKGEITQKLAKTQQLNRIKEQIADVHNKVKSAGSIAAAQEQFPELKYNNLTGIRNTENIQGIGREPVLASKIFDFELNKISEPIRGDNGYYIIQVTNRTVPEDSQIQENITEFKERLRLNAFNNAFMQWYRVVKEKAVIEDFRSDYFREY